MLTTVITFLLVLGLLVLVHEAGHFMAARRAGIRVDEFAIGFPPRLVKWRSRKHPDTLFSVNLLPLGGYVKIKGEQGEHAGDADSFSSRPPLTRAWILSAGVLMNLLLAAALLTVGFSAGLPQVVTDEPLPYGAQQFGTQLQIVEVVDSLPAQREGIQLGDVIVGIDGQAVASYDELQGTLDGRAGEEVALTVRRGDELVTRQLVPEILEQTERAGLGVALVETARVRYPFPLALWHGVVATFTLTGAVIAAFYGVVRDLLIGTPVSVDIAGPVGIASLTSQVASLGFVHVMQFAALLSINLAVINYLPFPALDGGRVLFLIFEKLRGRRMKESIEAAWHNAGFVVLLGLILLVTVRDVSKISEGFAGLVGRLTGG